MPLASDVDINAGHPAVGTTGKVQSKTKEGAEKTKDAAEKVVRAANSGVAA